MHKEALDRIATLEAKARADGDKLLDYSKDGDFEYDDPGLPSQLLKPLDGEVDDTMTFIENDRIAALLRQRRYSDARAIVDNYYQRTGKLKVLGEHAQ